MTRTTLFRGIAILALWGGAAVANEPQASGAPLRLDLADVEALAALDEVDRTEAERIVALRTKRGGLSSVEALRVLGFDEPTLDALRNHTVLGLDLDGGPSTSFSSPEEVLAQFNTEPDVRRVQDWANEYAQLRPETVKAWLRASRGFAALPRVQFEYRLKDDYGYDYQYFDQTGVPPTSNDVPTQSVLTDADQGQDRTILVRATWNLDKLVMSSEQIRVINEAQDVVKLREKILSEVTRLYFERRRLQVDILLEPRDDVRGQVRDQLRLAELTASLDAYTGGRFSEALSK